MSIAKRGRWSTYYLFGGGQRRPEETSWPGGPGCDASLGQNHVGIGALSHLLSKLWFTGLRLFSSRQPLLRQP